MKGINDIIEYLHESKIITMYTRSKYSINLHCGASKVKNIQILSDISLEIEGKIYNWIPEDLDEKYLSYLPLEFILEVEIKSVDYDYSFNKMIIVFNNDFKLIIDDENFEGIWPIYEVGKGGF